jgi:hypothetical protein
MRLVLCVFAILCGPAFAQDGSPLSAIDWLSKSVTTPATTPLVAPLTTTETPVANSATSPQVTVTSLDGQALDTVGLLSPAMTGLPRNLWAGSDEATLATLIAAQDAPALPALQDFLIVLMLAQSDGPMDAGPDGDLFLARVDKLLDFGALDQAQSLLEAAVADTPPLFRRWFDVALLTGTEDKACSVMQTRPTVAPTYPARIFCLARNGDWAAAALTLNTHRALGDVTDEEDVLLSRFLDPDLYEGEGSLPPSSRISPLVFRMRQAIGEGISTAELPLAFAQADLGDTTGWKAQLEAAERLARHGAISPNALQALYTSRTPSASGGVWDRVAAFQAFDTAMAARDTVAIAAALPAAWAAMKSIKAEVAFAQLYSRDLQTLGLTGDAKTLAFEVGLLSPDYETVALENPQADPFLRALAQGVPLEVPAPEGKARAIQAAFDGALPPAAFADLISNGKLGEALLRTLAAFESGLAGDPQSITDAIATLRSVGLEDVARRTALQMMLLDRAL